MSFRLQGENFTLLNGEHCKAAMHDDEVLSLRDDMISFNKHSAS